MSVSLTNNFLSNARGLTLQDGGGLTWTIDPNTNAITGTTGSGGGLSGANPTASVGLAAVNGAAITYMRSDAAPALSQAITPTWTALHTFTGGITVSGTTTIDGYTLTLTGNASIQGTNTGDQVIPAGANPAASVGLAAVNGIATSFMRSDAAPALSQAITPTWTALHTFAGGLTVNGSGGNSTLTLTGSGAYSSVLAANAAGGGQFALTINGSNALLITTALAATFEGELAINGGTPTAKPAGYGTPSGTPTASLTSASTLAETAGTLAALLAYLKTIGFVGT